MASLCERAQNGSQSLCSTTQLLAQGLSSPLKEKVRHRDWFQAEKDAINRISVHTRIGSKTQKDGINKVSVQSDLETAKLARVACLLILIKLIQPYGHSIVLRLFPESLLI